MGSGDEGLPPSGTAQLAAEPDFAKDDVGDLFNEENRSISQAASEARNAYEAVRGLYEAFAAKLAEVITECLSDQKVTVHSVTHRAKSPDSFERKAAQPSPDNPLLAKYDNAVDDITDKAGVRVITYFRSTVDTVACILAGQFEVLEKTKKISSEPDRLGYQSDHYLIKYSDERAGLPEYRRFAGLIAEIQVRTILQHAWAEIEHDVQYKSVATLPSEIRRRFAELAGLIEIADREFQAIGDAGQALLAEARRNVDLGHLDQVEITPEALRAYLDRAYGADGRMSEWSYGWTARILRRLGFQNLAEVDTCIHDHNDDRISRAIYGSRQGQLTRFESVLLACMGTAYILAHPWAEESSAEWFIPSEMRRLDRLKKAGIAIGEYRPPAYPETKLRVSDLEPLVERYRLRSASDS